MLRALFYLRFASLKNLLRSRLQRLRQPKYLAGALFALAYFYFFFFRHAYSTGSQPAGGLPGFRTLQDPAVVLVAAGSAILFVIFLCMWAAPSAQPRLNFSEAEIAFLFPAPLTRRGLVHYKLLSNLFSTLLQSLLYALLFNTRRIFSADGLLIVGAWWLLLSLVTLHYQAASMTVARLAASGIDPRRRRRLVLAAIALLLALAAWSFWRSLARLPADTSLLDVERWIPLVFTGGALSVLLWPFRLFLQPFLAADLPGFFWAVLPVLLGLGLHYGWVVWLNVSFEDAAIQQAERRAARVAELQRSGTLRLGAPRAARRRVPFKLARAPWPELAFLWKNLLSTSRPWFTPRAWLIAAGTIFLVSVVSRQWLGSGYWKVGGGLATIGSMLGGIALLYGPLLSRLDLRQDLAHADILKTYPLPGWRILLGELLAPIAVLTGLVWLGLLAWYLGLHGHQPPALSTVWLSGDMRLVLVLCAAVVAPAVIGIELLVPNAVPLLFPSWFQAVRTPGGGIDLMGQRMIFGFGQVLVVLLALLPSALGGALLVFILYGWLALAPAIAVVSAAGVVLLVLIAEFWCGVWLLGQRFEKLDLSAEPRP